MLFRYIDGKEADGPNRIAPQGYITTASNVLANAFGLALRTCLAVAFVQHLWHLLRVTTMKVSIIESLFCVRANPFLLCQASVIRATPLLCLLAIVILLSQVVTSFPPGAISITSTQKTSFGDVQVPTFNASFVSVSSSGVMPYWLSTSNTYFSDTSLNIGRWATAPALMPMHIL